MRKFILTVVCFLYISMAVPATRDYQIQYAPGINPKDFYRLDPRLIDVVEAVAQFCQKNGVQLVITSMIRTKERNLAVKSRSLTHVEGRAVDFSVKERWGWNEAKLMLLMEEMEMRFKSIGAISYMGNRRTILLIHETTSKEGALHAHIQVDRKRPNEKTERIIPFKI